MVHHLFALFGASLGLGFWSWCSLILFSTFPVHAVQLKKATNASGPATAASDSTHLDCEAFFSSPDVTERSKLFYLRDKVLAHDDFDQIQTCLERYKDDVDGGEFKVWWPDYFATLDDLYYQATAIVQVLVKLHAEEPGCCNMPRSAGTGSSGGTGELQTEVMGPLQLQQARSVQKQRCELKERILERIRTMERGGLNNDKFVAVARRTAPTEINVIVWKALSDLLAMPGGYSVDIGTTATIFSRGTDFEPQNCVFRSATARHPPLWLEVCVARFVAAPVAARAFALHTAQQAAAVALLKMMGENRNGLRYEQLDAIFGSRNHELVLFALERWSLTIDRYQVSRILSDTGRGQNSHALEAALFSPTGGHTVVDTTRIPRNSILQRNTWEGLIPTPPAATSLLPHGSSSDRPHQMRLSREKDRTLLLRYLTKFNNAGHDGNSSMLSSINPLSPEDFTLLFSPVVMFAAEGSETTTEQQENLVEIVAPFLLEFLENCHQALPLDFSRSVWETVLTSGDYSLDGRPQGMLASVWSQGLFSMTTSTDEAATEAGRAAGLDSATSSTRTSQADMITDNTDAAVLPPQKAAAKAKARVIAALLKKKREQLHSDTARFLLPRICFEDDYDHVLQQIQRTSTDVPRIQEEKFLRRAVLRGLLMQRGPWSLNTEISEQIWALAGRTPGTVQSDLALALLQVFRRDNVGLNSEQLDMIFGSENESLMLYALENWPLKIKRSRLLQISDMHSDALTHALFGSAGGRSRHSVVDENFETLVCFNSWGENDTRIGRSISFREGVQARHRIWLGSERDRSRLLRYLRKFAGRDATSKLRFNPLSHGDLEQIFSADFLFPPDAVETAAEQQEQTLRSERLVDIGIAAPFLVQVLDAYEGEFPLPLLISIWEKAFGTTRNGDHYTLDGRPQSFLASSSSNWLSQRLGEEERGRAAQETGEDPATVDLLPGGRDSASHSREVQLEQGALAKAQARILAALARKRRENLDSATAARFLEDAELDFAPLQQWNGGEAGATATPTTLATPTSDSQGSAATISALGHSFVPKATHPEKIAVLRSLCTHQGGWLFTDVVTKTIYTHAGVTLGTVFSDLAVARLRMQVDQSISYEHIDAILRTKNTDLIYLLLDKWPVRLSKEAIDGILKFDWTFSGFRFLLQEKPSSSTPAGGDVSEVTNDMSPQVEQQLQLRPNRAGAVRVIAKLLDGWKPRLGISEIGFLLKKYPESAVSQNLIARYPEHVRTRALAADPTVSWGSSEY
ncbi:unnamed protein product [Amoebophrya sp. A120]|nr:unnamed protein product [Amoebophrya sp. A120]|eukprot:GSA120T00025418001.1